MAVECLSDASVVVSEVRGKIIRIVGNQAVAKVESTIAKAGAGHFLAMKYLFEMVGLFPATASIDPESEDSLTRTLLRNLGLPEENGVQELGLQTKVTKEKCSHADEATGHAVK